VTFKVIEAFGPIAYRKTYEVYDIRTNNGIIEFLIYDDWHEKWEYIDAQSYRPTKE